MNLKVYKRKTIKPEEVLQEKASKLRWKKAWKRLVYTLITTAVSVVVLFGFLFGAGIIRGQSMTPFFQDGDIVIFCRFTKSYQYNEVISFKKDNQDYKFIKRIVAIPGDTLDIDYEGRLTINKKVLENTAAKANIEYPITLKKGEYFVLGDNRENAIDSRDFGSVNKNEINGKVIFVLRTKIH